jgi:DNA-binding transcriptional ArsR family regulator
MAQKTKEDRLQELKVYILESNPSWSFLMEELDVSEATLSRYLNELREKGLIEKDLQKDDSIVYKPKIDAYKEEGFFDVDNIEGFLEEEKEKLQTLEKFGLFDGGMTSEDILEFMRENPAYFEDRNLKGVEDGDNLTLRHYEGFQVFLYNFFINIIRDEPMETKVKFDIDPEEIVERKKESIQEAKERAEEDRK